MKDIAAFSTPHQIIDANDIHFKLGEKGMSLRDYFAAKAMPALISSLSFKDEAEDMMISLGFGQGEFDKLISKCAYDYADAMLKARQG